MKLKKIMSIVLCLAMVLSTMSFTVFASETVTTEADLKQALATNGTVVLGGNIDVEEQIVIPDGITVTLDLNGYKITGGWDDESIARHIYVLSNNGNLTIKDSAGNGAIVSRGIYNYGTLTLEGGTINACDGSGGYAVSCEYGSLFTMNGGVVTASYEDGDAPEPGNYDATPVNIPTGGEAILNGGEITNVCNFTFAVNVVGGTLTVPSTSTVEASGLHGAVSMSSGQANIGGGTFICKENPNTTDNTIYVEGGTLNITGGTFIGDGDGPNGGTCVAQLGGSAIISGGDFSKSSGGDVWGTTGSTTITGGTFENLEQTEHVQEGAVITNAGVTYVKTSTGFEEYKPPVATVNGVEYKTLEEALKAVTTDSVVNILTDVTISDKWDSRYTGANFTVPVTIDGNGHTLTFTGEVSDGYNHLAIFRFEDVATVKNLTIDASAATSIQRGISAKLGGTVENCTFIGNYDGTNGSARFAYIFGEGAGAAISDVEVSVIGCTFEDWRYGVADNCNGQDVKAVTVTENDFDNAKALLSATDSIVFTGNVVENGYVEINSYTAAETVAVTATGNTLEGAKDKIAVNPANVTADDAFARAIAKIGTKYYASLQDAFDAAKDGDTIEIIADFELSTPTTNKNDITLDLNGKTITGKDDTDKSFGLITNTGALTVTGNGKMTLKASVNSGWGRYSSVISNTVGGKLVVENGTFEHLGGTDMAYGIDNLTNGKGTYAETIINGGNIISTYRAIRQFLNGIEANNSLTINGGTVEGANKSVWMQDPSANANTGTLIVTENATLKGDVYLYVAQGSTQWPVTVSIAQAALVDESEVLSANVPTGYDVIRTANGYEVTTNESEQADTISVVYEDITSVAAEGEKTYAIVVKANDGDMINELASVDLSFVFTEAPVTNGDITFTVAPAAGFAMTEHEDTVRKELEKRYMFNYNGVGSNYEGTANAITIGTIKVTGYGEFTIATADVNTNVVNATTVNDNLVDSYTAAGATDNSTTTGALDITHGIDDGEIAIPVRTLTITIDFPNEVIDQTKAYQDMKVEITGNIDGVHQTVAYALGEGMVNGSYVVKDERLVLNDAYTVTVSGAGYRTARYTVTMTEDKALRFWNNVMDEAQVVEIGKDSSAVNVTFLAGDIVKDNKINIYDLSAVVSYFGTETNTAAYDAYAKYDLNRDGVIDSKDVAYVLVSWNN